MYRFLTTISNTSNAVFPKSAARNLISTTKLLSTVAEANKGENDHRPLNWHEAKPYSEIPRLQGFRVLRNFFPGGKYYKMPLIKLNKKLKEDFGDIIITKGLFGKPDIVLTYSPKDFEQVYRMEGLSPNRRHFETFVHFRKDIRPDVYGDNIGLLLEQGEKWRELRSKMNPVMMQPRITKQYIKPVEEITDEFIEKILPSRDSNDELPSNFVEEMNKWSLESIGCIALDSRLGCLKDDLIINADSKEMIQSIHDILECTYKLEFLPSLWKYVRTPTYNKLMRAMETITNISLKRIDEAMESLKNKPEGKSEREASVLEKLLKIDRNMAIVMSMDMLLGGVDSTPYTCAILLYFLGINPKAQDKLREEIKTILPKKDSMLSSNSFDHVPYLRACMKEASRMIPVVTGTIRKIPVDLVLSGYQIPKGSEVAMTHAIPAMQPDQFPNPEKFIPERWLNDQDITECPSAKAAHPFVHMPFGFGPRSCIGKRFAELVIKTLIVKLLRSHKVEWNHGELQVTSLLITTPVSPLKFKITEV